MSNDNDFLIHYGVKGQKWGVRKYQEEDGVLTEEGRRHYGVGKRKEGKLAAVGSKIRKTANKAVESVRAKVKDTVAEKRGPEHMSDSELDERLKRMRKESEYARLKREIEGGGNQGGGGGKKGGGKKHPYLALALLTPVATAIGVGTKAITTEKVTQFLDHRAGKKLNTFINSAKTSTNSASLGKLWEGARRAASTAGHEIKENVNIGSIVNANLGKKAASIALKDSKKVTQFINRTSLTNPVLRRGSRSFKFRGGYGS